MSSKHKNKTISFRITEAERKQIEVRIIASGMMKKDYFIRSCIYNRICVVDKKETIYPLVQTVNALYLKLLDMQKTFTSSDQNIDTLPSSDEINELQIEFSNMLTAIIDLLDGAKYLWKGDCHEHLQVVPCCTLHKELTHNYHCHIYMVLLKHKLILVNFELLK